MKHLLATLLLLFAGFSHAQPLTPVTFTFGLATDSSGAASETSLRNGLQASINEMVLVHNDARIQRAAIWEQTSNAVFRLANIEYFTENIWDGINSVVNQLGYVRDNGVAATNFLAMVCTNLMGANFWAETNYLQSLIRDAHLQAISDQLEDVIAHTYTTTERI